MVPSKYSSKHLITEGLPDTGRSRGAGSDTDLTQQGLLKVVLFGLDILFVAQT